MSYGGFKIDGVSVLTPSYDTNFTDSIVSTYAYRNYKAKMIILPVGRVVQFTWKYKNISDTDYKKIIDLALSGIDSGTENSAFHNVTTYAPGRGFTTFKVYLDQNCLNAEAVMPKGSSNNDVRWNVELVWIGEGTV